MVNICNLDLMYNADFQFSLPRVVIESFISGNAFDYKKNYTAQELADESQDINDLFTSIMAENPLQEKVVYITCGAPGAGKTTLAEQHKAKQEAAYAHKYGYIDPDAVCLKSGLNSTYRKELEEAEAAIAAKKKAVEEGDESREEKRIALQELAKELFDKRKELYDKWRPASNAATHIIIAHLMLQERAFYFGTTASSPQTAKFFEFLKAKGYKIELIHVAAPDDVRWKSIQRRDRDFVQTTEKDTKEKGQLVPQRINDTYLKYADKIEFYYRGGVTKDAVLAATWIRNADESEKSGTLTVANRTAYNNVKRIQNTVVAQIAAATSANKDDLTWQNAVEENSDIVWPVERGGEPWSKARLRASTRAIQPGYYSNLTTRPKS